MADGPPRVWKKDEKLRIEVEGRTEDATVILAAPNGVSLVVAFEAVLGGYVGHVPLVFQNGAFRDLFFKREWLLHEVN